MLRRLESSGSLSPLKGIIEGINKEARSLLEEYNPKVKEARELRRKRRKEDSNELLEQHIGIPLFPAYVKKEMKRRFVVTNDEEALVIAHAMHQWVCVNIPFGKHDPEHERTVWRAFVEGVKNEGVLFLRRLAEQYRRDIEREALEVGLCPRCLHKLIRQPGQGTGILICSSCGSSYPISQKGG